MANISYKLFDPSSNEYVQFDDGSDIKTTSAPKEQIEAFAAKNGFKVNYLESAADYGTPKIPMGDIGMDTIAEANANKILSATPATTTSVMTPLEESAAEVTPLGAAGGGLLSGMTLGWRDEIFGKNKRGVKPAEAEKAAYPLTFGATKMVGSLVPNILADLGILAASRGRIKSPTALATAGGAVTGGIESLGESEKPLSQMTMQDVYETSGAMLGGALGGAAGQKILGPLFGAAGRYVGSKFPKGSVSFPGRAGVESTESQMRDLASKAEKEMVKKAALEGEKAPLEASEREIQSTLNKAYPEVEARRASVKGIRDTIRQAEEQIQNFIPTEADTIRFKQIEEESRKLAEESRKVGFGQKPIMKKDDVAFYDKYKQNQKALREALRVVEEEKKKIEDLNIFEDPDTFIDQINYPNPKSYDLDNLLSRPVSDLGPDELWAMIERSHDKRLKTTAQINKLVAAISEIDASISTKKRLFDTLEKKIKTFDPKLKQAVQQYFNDMRTKTLGGLVGRQIGALPGIYGSVKSSKQDYTEQALNSLLMPK